MMSDVVMYDFLSVELEYSTNNFQCSTSNGGRTFTTECAEAFHRGAGGFTYSFSSVNTSKTLCGKKNYTHLQKNIQQTIFNAQ